MTFGRLQRSNENFVFTTNISTFTTCRKCRSAVAKDDIQWHLDGKCIAFQDSLKEYKESI